MRNRINERRPGRNRSGVGIGMAIGVALGVALGSATQNIGLWLPIGIAIGLSLGAAFSVKREQKDKNPFDKQK
ncbi:MAG TPA: hypothetical protein PKO30_03005 [Prolixibacteraceae bacterium]|nr:hypothetical protein [Prolixibacteraceae bacterium]